jgi:uncharacterized protein YdeI (YjbR/CyaY-like superfamily)
MKEVTLYVPDRNSWRDWLHKHGSTEKEIWLIYYKKHTKKPSIPYGDAVEEALCFGWIDSLVRRIDDERYMQKYTPRKPRSTWSVHNVRRVEKMMAEGKMTEKGLWLYEFAREKGLLPETEEKTPGRDSFPEAPPEFMDALKANPRAEDFYNSLAPSYKLQYAGWIAAAKREETRRRRIDEAVQLLESGQKLGMK